MVSSRTLRVNDDLPMVHDDKRTLAWFHSGRLELLFGIERVRVRVFLYFTTFTSHSFDILFLTDQMKGFVSIFQLLGRYVRRISVVFYRNFTRRDNQHVRFSLHKQPVSLQILRNFVVHKPHTRKTCLAEPLRRIIEPLRRNIEPHCGIIEPLRRNVEHHCEVIEPIQRNIWLHCGTIEPLRRKVEHFSSKAKKTCANIESLCGINKSFSVNQRLALQGESAGETSCQNTARKSFSDRESIDVKAMVNHYENSREIIIPRNCHMIDRSSNERSITVYTDRQKNL